MSEARTVASLHDRVRGGYFCCQRRGSWWLSSPRAQSVAVCGDRRAALAIRFVTRRRVAPHRGTKHHSTPPPPCLCASRARPRCVVRCARRARDAGGPAAVCSPSLRRPAGAPLAGRAGGLHGRRRGARRCRRAARRGGRRPRRSRGRAAAGGCSRSSRCGSRGSRRRAAAAARLRARARRHARRPAARRAVAGGQRGRCAKRGRARDECVAARPRPPTPHPTHRPPLRVPPQRPATTTLTDRTPRPGRRRLLSRRLGRSRRCSPRTPPLTPAPRRSRTSTCRRSC